jgi:hypothetical protein
VSRQVGIALSGGGHRATAFAVGVLLYLSKAEVRGQVASIASVSGGSLANASLAARLDFASDPSEDAVTSALRQIARRCTGRWLTLSGFARLMALAVIGVWAVLALVGVWFLPVDLELQAVALVVGVLIMLGLIGLVVTGRGSLFGWWGTWAYLAVLLLLAELVAVGVPRLRHSQALRDAFDLVGVSHWADSVVTVIVLVAIGLLLVAALLGLRGRVAGRAFAHTLFPDGPSTRLDALTQRSLDHVICATDLHAGHNVYFGGSSVYGYDFGVGTPGSLHLHVPSQASAGFPGAFPVRFLRTSRFNFDGPREHDSANLALVDGGVYDNMADQWVRGFDARLARLGTHAPAWRDADELVVVSASAGLDWRSTGSLRLPLVGELFGLMRDNSVLYDNGNSLRRQDLVTRFQQAQATGSGLRGALVHIEQSPFLVPQWFAQNGDNEEKARAEAALGKLAGEDQAAWEEVAEADAQVPTTLVALSDAVTARLLRHAYVLAMVNLHVILDYSLGDVPPLADFEALLASGAV